MCSSLLQAFSQSESFPTLLKIQDFRIRTTFLQLSHRVNRAVGLRLGLGGGSKAPAALDIFTMFTSLSSTCPICPWAEPHTHRAGLYLSRAREVCSLPSETDGVMLRTMSWKWNNERNEVIPLHSSQD